MLTKNSTVEAKGAVRDSEKNRFPDILHLLRWYLENKQANKKFHCILWHSKSPEKVTSFSHLHFYQKKKKSSGWYYSSNIYFWTFHIAQMPKLGLALLRLFIYPVYHMLGQLKYRKQGSRDLDELKQKNLHSHTRWVSYFMSDPIYIFLFYFLYPLFF